jgi:AmmeMemoRadiSam system protein B
VSLARLLVALALLLAGASVALSAPVPCPEGENPYPPFYDDAGLFTKAIAKVAEAEPSNVKLSGITVPHHLLADRLVALGFRSASAFRYRRIVILSPDHFRKAERPFATTTRGFETARGPVATDTEAARALLSSSDLIEESCLFDKDHGVRAMLPFIRHYFPEAKVVPVAMSIKSTRKDWDRLAAALETIVDQDTLIVESTDFSHYLPQHVARGYDQQTLNVLAAGSLDQIAALRQPAHADSVGALYVQVKLQQRLFGAAPLVLANANSQAWSDKETTETTSYVVALFGRFGAGFNSPAGEATSITYLAGDTNFGRYMKTALLEEGARERVVAAVHDLTRGRPLVVNLEGVILPNVPEAIDDMTLAMPEDLAIPMLKALGVAGAGLANNHALDLGPSGLAETRRALLAAGIPSFAQGEMLALPSLDLVGLTDIDTNGSRQTDLITPELLDRLVQADATRPTVAFVHWGREYIAEPSAREAALADGMRLRAVPLVVGAHPHVTDGALTALSGGDTLVLHSLGNFLFDQNADRSSGALLELRVFAQGTVFARVIPLPNLFEVAKGE